MARRAGGARWLAMAAVASLAWAAPGQAVAACGASKVGNDLQLLGDANTQAILIQDDGTILTVSIDCNYNGVTPDYTTVGDVNGATFTGIETIHLLPGGKDTVSYVQTGPWSGVRRYLGVVEGPFTNSITATLNNTISANSSLAVEVWGGVNQDIVSLDFAGATLTDSAVFVYADLGTGWDRVTLKEPQATGNSKVDVELALGPDRDNQVDVYAQGLVSGSRYRVAIEGDTNAQFERDRVYLSLGATFDNDSRFLLTANLRGGNDIFSGYLSSWPATDKLQILNGSEVRLRVNGETGNDFLGVSQGSAPGNLTVDGLLEIVLRGGLHNDNLDTSLSGIAGTGTVRLREHGGVYPDVVTFGILTDLAATNNLDVVVQGGRGLDVLSGGVFAGAGVSVSPLGAAILDGSVEPDRCLTFGNPALQTVSCELAF